MRYFLFFILFFLAGLTQAHAAVVPVDTAKVEVREFDKEKIEEFKKDKTYNYETKEGFLHRWWNNFWKWFWSLFEKNLDKVDKVTPSKAPFNPSFLNIIIIGAIIVVVILGLTKVKFQNWITGKGASIKMDYELEEENIHEIDFDHDLHQAEKEGDYRRAVRLRFLKILKYLSDEGKISWEINKTNHEYKYELKDKTLYADFVTCVNIFDNVWYGEMPIGQAYYLEKKPLFESLVKNASGKKTSGSHG